MEATYGVGVISIGLSISACWVDRDTLAVPTRYVHVSQSFLVSDVAEWETAC